MLKENQSENLSTSGKTTPFLVAVIVHQYICDNNFLKTHSIFRNEASSLFNCSFINEENLSSLGDMLDEYICLKQQKGMLDQQMVEMMQEKNRVHMLLQGLQNSINVYNTFPMPSSQNVTIMNTDSVVIPKPRLCNKTPSAVSTLNVEAGNFSTPMISLPQERKYTQVMKIPMVAKKPRGRPPSWKFPIQSQNTMPSSSNFVVNDRVVSQHSSATQSSYGNCVINGSHVQASPSCHM